MVYIMMSYFCLEVILGVIIAYFGTFLFIAEHFWQTYISLDSCTPNSDISSIGTRRPPHGHLYTLKGVSSFIGEFTLLG